MSTHVIRRATPDDAGTIAYLMLKWDAELPDHVRQLRGNAQWAEFAAHYVVATPLEFGMHLLEVDGAVCGGYCVHYSSSIFSPEPHGSLIMWYVVPEHRGGLHGMRLLKSAIDFAAANDLPWLEVQPWADDTGAFRVLERLGFHDGVHVYAKQLRQ